MDEPSSPANPIDAIAGVVPPAAQDQLKADAGAVVDEARDVLDTARHEATDQFSALKDQAQGQIADATDKAKSFAGEQKDIAGDQLGGIAAAISKVADDLAGDQPMVAGYARDLAGGMKSVSDSVKSRNVDELIGMAEDFGRKQPLAFLGAAALAGFVASRFVLASAQRRSEGNATSTSTPGSKQGDY
jgi:ElaB/YqjD/DUF883 family membrane-anchored ribosome-binding protein